MRSLLFIPGDSEKKLSKVLQCSADAVILDLEDSVSDERKPVAREMVVAFLRDHPRTGRAVKLWVRVNPLDTPLALQDLAAIVAGDPDGVMLPKANGPEDVRRLGHHLDALEVAFGIAPGSVRILPVATETAIAPFRLGDYAGNSLPRLAGLTWGAEDLSSAIGASTNLGPDGQWALTYQLVRSMTLLAASAAGVPAYDTLYVDYRDEEGLIASSRAARNEGFEGRIAIHPDQVRGINLAFSPSPEDVAFARRVVETFANAGDAGTVGLDGRMLDKPHLVQAHKTLARAERLSGAA